MPSPLSRSPQALPADDVPPPVLHAIAGVAAAPAPDSVTSSRYATLDAWRAVAAVWVTLYHLWPHTGFVGRFIAPGWLGVHLFFPISGYCIYAALQSPANRTIGRFVRRRWRRIFPPYWASIVLAVVLSLIVGAIDKKHAGWHELALPWTKWLAVATLTQTLFGAGQVINDVYWTLCWEEQFYLAVALCLLLPKRTRQLGVLALTVMAVAYRLPHWHSRVGGLFLDRWPEFAAGIAIYALYQGRGLIRLLNILFAITIFCLCCYSWRMRRDDGIALALVFAVALAVLRPYDAWLAGRRWLRPLMALGTMSFSLYLVHLPVGGRARYLINWMAPYIEGHVVSAMATIMAFGAALLFYAHVERRFFNPAPTKPRSV